MDRELITKQLAVRGIDGNTIRVAETPGHSEIVIGITEDIAGAEGRTISVRLSRRQFKLVCDSQYELTVADLAAPLTAPTDLEERANNATEL